MRFSVACIVRCGVVCEVVCGVVCVVLRTPYVLHGVSWYCSIVWRVCVCVCVCAVLCGDIEYRWCGAVRCGAVCVAWCVSYVYVCLYAYIRLNAYLGFCL